VPRWYRAGVVDDIARGSSVRLLSDAGRSVVIWHLDDGSVRATDDECTHFFWSLHESGRLEGTEVTCLAHEARFDVTTGAVVCPPARTPLATFPVFVDCDRNVFVRI